MLIKATRLHPGEPLQEYIPVIVDMVVAEVVVDDMVVVVVESGVVVGNVLVIAEATI